MAWPKGPRVHRYKVGQEVKYHDEDISGRWIKTKILRLGKEDGQNYYVIDHEYGRIAYPSQIRAISASGIGQQPSGQARQKGGKCTVPIYHTRKKGAKPRLSR